MSMLHFGENTLNMYKFQLEFYFPVKHSSHSTWKAVTDKFPLALGLGKHKRQISHSVISSNTVLN